MFDHTANHNTLQSHSHHGFSEKLSRFFHSPVFWATLLLLSILAALFVLGWLVGGSPQSSELPYRIPIYPYML